MPLPQSRDRIRNDVRLQRRLIRDLTNYVNSSGISISSDSQSDDDTVNLPISNISYQHQEPEHPHYRTETISSRARKVTRRGVDNQTKVMKRQNLQELLKQVQEGLQEDHHEEEDVKAMEDSVNHTPVHKPPKDEQSGVLKSGEWTEVVTDDWDNDFSIPPPAVLYGGVAKGKERSDTDTDDLDEIPATTMLKLRMAPSRLLQADDVMSHYSHQSRGSRATADRSNYSRSSRQHSLSPVRRVNPKVRKAPTIESIFQEEHQISLPTDR